MESGRYEASDPVNIDFSDAAGGGFSRKCLVTGHDFSRAVRAKKDWPSGPVGTLVPVLDFIFLGFRMNDSAINYLLRD
jgi:hypothetical protein